jgi:hypothetical protein
MRRAVGGGFQICWRRIGSVVGWAGYLRCAHSLGFVEAWTGVGGSRALPTCASRALRGIALLFS